jgi:hypothetical protein
MIMQELVHEIDRFWAISLMPQGFPAMYEIFAISKRESPFSLPF